MTTPEHPTRQRFGLAQRWLLVGLLVTIVAGVGGIYLWRAREATNRRESLEAAARGDLVAAEPGLLRAYNRNPNDAEVVEAIALAYLKADSLRAEGFLSRWVELRPGQAEPLRARMEYYRKRRDGKALEDSRRLLELDPTNFQLRRSVMAQAFSYGSFEEAETLCRECLEAQPSDPFLRTILAEIRRARGDAPGAATILDQLIAEFPQNTGPLLARATLYQEGGEWAKSGPLLRTVYDRDPRQRRAAGYLLSLALERTGSSEESRKVLAEVRRLQDVEVFSDAIKNQPDNLELQTRLGATLLNDGHTQDGLQLLNAVLTRDPWFRPAHQALATYYEQHGEATRAAEHRRLAGPGDGT